MAEIQAEINELARTFPHLVQNHNGSIPAVTPITLKRKKTPDKKLSAQRKAYWANLAPAERAAKLKRMIAARNKNRKLKARTAEK